MQIADNSIVSLRYIMKNSDGEEIENTFTGPAVEYLHGAGKILPQLELLLVGLKAGDKKSISLDLPDTFHIDVEIDDVRMATPDEIKSGKPVTVNSCGPDCQC